MNNYVIELAKRLLRKHEGLRLSAYLCPTGHKTIGYGRNLEAKPWSKTEKLILIEAGLEHNAIDEPFAEWVLDTDTREAAADLDTIFGASFYGASFKRQAALIDMRFNLGGAGFRSFKKMIAAIRSGLWTLAATEVLDSKYAEQVKNRAKTIATLIRGY